MSRALRNISFIWGGLIILGLVSISYSQTDNKEKPVEPIKFDEVGDVDTCEFLKRISKFFQATSNKPDHQGYIINYGFDTDIANREQWITQRIASRNFDRSRITLVRGGYLPVPTTEFWLIPPHAKNPNVSKSEPEPPAGTVSPHASLFDTTYFQEFDEFVLDSIKQKEEEERRQEQHDDGDQDAEEDYGPNSPPRDRFKWTEVYVPFDLQAQNGSKIMIIFYADEDRYDIRAITQFIEQGRDRLAKETKLPKERLIVVFGGYRESPEAEFWFVPRNGKEPVPDSLCKDDSQTE
jgi:hypothetical protein